MTEQIDKGGSTGQVLGRSGGKIGFYGLATPIAKPSVATAITTGATVTATISLARSLRLALVNLGLVNN